MTPLTVTLYTSARAVRHTQDASIQPLCIGVCFSGDLPRHLVHGVVPIQISVSIAEEYRSFTTLIMESLALDGYPYSENSGSENVCALPSLSPATGMSRYPLPSNFNHTNSHHWSQLSEQIQRWLVNIPSDSQHWTWGRDAFWFAFVGAFPDFPGGSWSRWDTRIPLEGQFIEQWLEAGAASLDGDESHENLLEKIWAEFCAHTMLFYPDPLLSLD
ncbi:hypothetical protein EV424DRAFT_1320831 [Suillus variegatus]|nr:hypothetical protein EV424DRAFT_1320831 [Suillus variegatus]